MVVDAIGAVCFGLVIGWVTYLPDAAPDRGSVAISNIASVVGAVGGAAVTGLFSGHLFGWYCIGLAAGFFGYLILAVTKLKDGGTVAVALRRARLRLLGGGNLFGLNYTPYGWADLSLTESA